MGLIRQIIEVVRREGVREVFRRALQQMLVKAGHGILGLAHKLTDVAHLALGPEERKLLARNAIFKNKHRGRRAFIIGNGPSLAQQDLSKLKGEITFVVNRFWDHPILDVWQPTYYCLHDPLFFDGSEACLSFFSGLRARVSGSTFLVPHYARTLVEKGKLLPEAQTYYVAIRGNLQDGMTRPPDLSEAIPAAASMVSQLAMIAALAMGCSPIYLLGLDHDWLAHRRDTHFYEGKTLPHQASKAPGFNEGPYKRDMETMLEIWTGYEVLRDYASKHGLQIINATEGGFLDVFPRERYAALFAAP